VTFFDKKEDVINIELTPYGRSLMAMGKLQPAYYAFFDDDILYDGARAGFAEDNNDIEPRIQETTPSIRTQTSFVDLEKLIMKQTHDLTRHGVYHESNVSDLKSDPSVFQDYDGLRFVLPLGNSQIGNKYLASWRVEFLEGNFKASRNSINDNLDKSPVIPIPQIQCDWTVQPKLAVKDFKGVVDPESGRYAAVNSANSNFIRLENDYILLDVSEANVDLLNDSFSIEVYEIVTEDGREIMKPKLFKKEVQRVINGLMVEEEEYMEQILANAVETDSNFAEYYFEISADDAIDNKTKSEKIASREVRGNIFDKNVGYDDFIQKPGSELYTSDNDGDNC